MLEREVECPAQPWTGARMAASVLAGKDIERDMMMQRVFSGLTVLGLALGPLCGCAGTPSARPASGTTARPTPSPGRVLDQGSE